MKKIRLIYLSVLLSFVLCNCQDELDVKNPNNPNIAINVANEAGLIAYAKGGVYYDGLSDGLGWLGDSYFSLPWAYQEVMADLMSADASNNQISTIGVPASFTRDAGGKVVNKSSTPVDIIRTYNSRAATGAGNNPLYFQWLSNYALNNASNAVLALVDKISYTGDENTKKNTFKAWCYWWKGFAYQQIGTMYYAGLVVDEAGTLSNEYVLHDQILARSDFYFKEAAAALDGVTSTADYQAVLGKLIPAHCQVGNGGVLTVAMWKRNINTNLARNILLNRLAPFVNDNLNASITGTSMPTMSAAEWDQVITLTSNGVQKGDFVFTGRTTGQNDFFTASAGYVALNGSGENKGSTLKVGERFVQHFKAGDLRFTNNFVVTSTYNNDFMFTTRNSLIDGGAGNGAFTYANSTPGEQEILIAGSYEENALMLAEANIRKGGAGVEAGLALIDDVREYMGAGLVNVAGTGLSQLQAMQELVRERRVALMFRGLSFFDNRRWGWTYPIAKGGGAYNMTVLENNGTLNTKSTIEYGFMDYWDVPADEIVLNPPSGTSSAVKNPNF